jgi:hypothetical protein
MLAQTSISARIKVEGHSAPRQGRRWGGISLSAEGQKIRSARSYTASASRRKRPAPQKWRPDTLLALGRQKVRRHNAGSINGLRREPSAPGTKNGGLGQRKSAIFRHFSPVHSGRRPAWDGRGERKRTSANWARRSSLYSRRRFPAKTGVCRTAMRTKGSDTDSFGYLTPFFDPFLRFNDDRRAGQYRLWLILGLCSEWRYDRVRAGHRIVPDLART